MLSLCCQQNTLAPSVSSSSLCLQAVTHHVPFFHIIVLYCFYSLLVIHASHHKLTNCVYMVQPRRRSQQRAPQSRLTPPPSPWQSCSEAGGTPRENGSSTATSERPRLKRCSMRDVKQPLNAELPHCMGARCIPCCSIPQTTAVKFAILPSVFSSNASLNPSPVAPLTHFPLHCACPLTCAPHKQPTRGPGICAARGGGRQARRRGNSSGWRPT